MDISIIIPAYNEELRIGLTLDKTLAYLGRQPWECEVLVVDDGSSDTTAQRVDAYADQGHPVYCLRNGENRGKGYSIRHGVGRARGRYIGFMDADYKTDIAALQQAWQYLEEGCDGVIGDRTLAESSIGVKRRRYREWGSQVFRGLLHWWLGLGDFGDTQCGFKFFRAPVIKDLFARQQVDGYMFDVEILLLARSLGHRLQPLPVIWNDDPDSRFKPVSGMLRNLGELIRIRRLQRRQTEL
ncbi:MAG: glycosyltransferase [Candidatus Latescibacteria bacterium]|nr:glycosyltransferase [Candidatus Latescibacterota bacterium]